MNHFGRFTPILGSHRRFVVSQNLRGQWIVREGTGLIDGVFRSRREAVRFALFETGSPDTVTVISGGTAHAHDIH